MKNKEKEWHPATKPLKPQVFNIFKKYLANNFFFFTTNLLKNILYTNYFYSNLTSSEISGLRPERNFRQLRRIFPPMTKLPDLTVINIHM